MSGSNQKTFSGKKKLAFLQSSDKRMITRIGTGPKGLELSRSVLIRRCRKIIAFQFLKTALREYVKSHTFLGFWFRDGLMSGNGDNLKI